MSTACRNCGTFAAPAAYGLTHRTCREFPASPAGTPTRAPQGSWAARRARPKCDPEVRIAALASRGSALQPCTTFLAWSQAPAFPSISFPSQPPPNFGDVT